jgi:signal transduction histidine kinase
VLAVYVYGIRRIGEWTQSRYGVRAGVIEAILILGLTLLAAPMRSSLERWFRSLFERETALYRDVVARVGVRAGEFLQLSELIGFIESQIMSSLPLRRVKIMVPDQSESDERLAALLKTVEEKQVAFVEDDPNLQAAGFDIAYALRREDRNAGVMLVEAAPGALTPDVRAVIEVLAGQIAIAIMTGGWWKRTCALSESSREGERLAALGQMAATVAHEVKNPLSAIKSIAQVMSRERSSAQHARDLSLIVSETDRLNKSVTQLLSFAGRQPAASTRAYAAEITFELCPDFSRRCGRAPYYAELFHRCRRQSRRRTNCCNKRCSLKLNPNSLQVSSMEQRSGASIAGCRNPGVCSERHGPGIRNQIATESGTVFYHATERYRPRAGDCVRKRMQEAGGVAVLVASENGKGARFELRLPWPS